MMDNDDQDDDHLDVDPDDPEEASRLRSAKLLQPTTEAELEHAERCRRNRITAIMQPEPPRVPRYDAPEVIYKRRDNALLRNAGPGSDGQSGSTRAAAQECSPCAAAPPCSAAEAERDLIAWWSRRAEALSKLAPADAMVQLLRAVGGADVAAARQRAKLEARVATLEAARERTRKLRRRVKALESGRVKPRIRIASGRSEQ